jgi:hypothetical protein
MKSYPSGYLIYYRGAHAITVCKAPEIPTGAHGRPTMDIVATQRLDADEIGQPLAALERRFPLVF